MDGMNIKIIDAQQTRIHNIYKNIKLNLLKLQNTETCRSNFNINVILLISTFVGILINIS